MSFGIANVAAITVLCYGMGMTAKNLEALNDKWIPVICFVSGCVLGAVAYLTGMPDYPASDIVTAIAVGAASGLAATGANQIGKQIKKDNEVFG